jgi:hypothetical protein
MLGAGGADNAHFSAQNILRAAGAGGMAAGASSQNQQQVFNPLAQIEEQGGVKQGGIQKPPSGFT